MTSFLSPRKPDPNFLLKAANNSTIKTYGFLTLPLDLGLRRHFSWRFVIADVHLPIIGSDFLAHFGLLPDCKYKLLLDRITSLSVREDNPQVILC
ncbi:retrotransposable element Tf2 155 kDa protein type 1 [Trichonephila inaurata madagascariensis]|uniref:Retrotransposable element Tf2 155 kDa protein type 1 n=1 Tax=Trichonephila inaurata madagascariensis TaxID=2747483 RepID=A0A8X7C6X0_9ARAC|nr:retrotransposable element Tf2 155 kDa protein type 1 [Trichonephila inaurata madagascariensis]